MSEEDYKKELEANGVELPEEPKAEEPTEPEEPKEEPAKEEPEEPKAPLQEPKEQRKRSIYDDYKDKKLELKSETERREAAERERDELRQKLEAVDKAQPGEERKEALDDVEQFVSKHKEWSPEAIREFMDMTRKGVKSEIPAELKNRLERFENWEKSNSAVIEKQMFEEEFQSSMPKLEKLFGKASADDTKALKAELDKLSHSKEWHDKPLAYIAFENQDTLKALISPKKRGMESKDRKDVEIDDFDFDPNADYSKMTPAQKEKWEAEYKKMTSGEQGLLTDSQGRKTII